MATNTGRCYIHMYFVLKVETFKNSRAREFNYSTSRSIQILNLLITISVPPTMHIYELYLQSRTNKSNFQLFAEQ